MVHTHAQGSGVTDLHILPPLLQETVPTIRKADGGTTPVPTPTSTGSGTVVATTGAATRMASTGLSSEEAPIHSRKS